MRSSSIQQQRAFLLLLFTTRRDRQCLVFFPITTHNVSMDRQALWRLIRESASAGWHTPFHFENTPFFLPHFVSRVAQLENQVRRSSVNTKAFFINFLAKVFTFFMPTTTFQRLRVVEIPPKTKILLFLLLCARRRGQRVPVWTRACWFLTFFYTLYLPTLPHPTPDPPR